MPKTYQTHHDKPSETRVSLRIPIDLYRLLHATAISETRSVNGQIVWILREYLSKTTR